MRRDAVRTDRVESDEAFVERTWTAVWAAQPDPAEPPDALAETEQFRLLAPFLAQMPPAARILDAGCGLGGWTRFLAGRGYDTVGLDISETTIERLRRLHPALEWVAADMRETGFDDETFDAELSWGAFEHFEEGIARCVAEARRILKPGGFLFVTVPLENARVRFLSRQPDAGRFYQWRFRPHELRAAIEHEGFEVLEIRPIGKWEGTRRALHELLHLDPERRSTMRLTTVLAAALPARGIAHMQFAAARKLEPA